MSKIELLRAYPPPALDRGYPKNDKINEVVQDSSSIRLARRGQSCMKYLVHMLLKKPEANDPFEGSRGRSLCGHKAIGIIGLRMDHDNCPIHGRSTISLTHKEWVRLCKCLGVFDDAYSQLDLTDEQRDAAKWNNVSGEYFSRNIWLREHWQLVRFQEQNPMIPVVTHSLAEILAATQQSSK